MFEQYLKERKSELILSSKHGFIIYKIVENVCLITEIFTLPEFRTNKIASNLADKVFEIAKENNCVEVQCMVDTNSNDASLSMIVILRYGFKVYRCEGQNIIRFYKGVN